MQKFTDIKDIFECIVSAAPGLVINSKVKASGRIPSVEKIKGWIQEIVKPRKVLKDLPVSCRIIYYSN